MSRSRERVSEDAVLGGRLVLRQPLRGHRFGHDAILLAAAVAAHAGEQRGRSRRRRRRGGTGAGAPRRGPCRHARRDRSGARRAGARQCRAQRSCRRACAPSVSMSRRRPPRSPPPGSRRDRRITCLMNPPFNAAQNPSPDRGRRAGAHRVGRDACAMAAHGGAAASPVRRGHADLACRWTRRRARGARARLRRDRGSCRSIPSRARRRSACWRAPSKARSGPLALLPGLVLADADGKPTAEAEAVLRDGAALPLTQRLN